MGRRRLKMKPIQNKNDRKAIFERRKKGLLKKASELSTLCEVNACVIIYPPESEKGQPQTFPQDPKQVIRNIEEYYDKEKCPEKPRKNYDLHKFFNDKKNQVEAESSKVREQRLKISYPTWDDSFDSLGEEQLRMFVSTLDSKLQECNQTIDLLKTKHYCLMGKAAESEVPVIPLSFGSLNDQCLKIPVITPHDVSDQSHLSFLQNMSEANFVPPPTKPLVDNSYQLDQFYSRQAQMLHFDSNPMLGRYTTQSSEALNCGFRYDCHQNLTVLEEDGAENYNPNWSFGYNSIGGLQSIMQPNYNYYPALENIACEDLKYHEAALQTLPPLMHGVQTNELYDLFLSSEIELYQPLY